MQFTEHHMPLEDRPDGPSMFFRRRDNPNAKATVICLHGVTRTGREFDRLAHALSENYTVILPDMPGRGRSDYIEDVHQYGFTSYSKLCANLILEETRGDVYWLGTSMGGVIGMMLAAFPHHRIKKLILNDVGPFMPASIFESVRNFLKICDRDFANLQEAIDFHKRYCQSFGIENEDEWEYFTRAGMVEKEDGRWRFDYDPRILDRHTNKPFHDLDIWLAWDMIDCPVLLLYGMKSIGLNQDTIDRMKAEGPSLDIVGYKHIGHAPALINESQINTIINWLAQP